MTIKRLSILILGVVLMWALTGCRALQQIVMETMSESDMVTEEDTTDVFGTDIQDAIPINVLMGYDTYAAPMISGDGQYILYLETSDYVYDVIARDWQTGEEIFVTWPPGYGYLSYMWAPDDETVLFFIDDSGDENYGLYTSNIHTGETNTILPGGMNDCYYVSDNPNDSDEIFLAVFDFDAELFDLYLVDYKTGDMMLVLKNPGDVTSWLIDGDGLLRVVTTTDDMAGSHVWLKSNPQNTSPLFDSRSWQEILSWDYEDADTSGVFGMMPDGERLLYLDSSIGDTSTLCTYDVDTGDVTEVYNDPGL